MNNLFHAAACLFTGDFNIVALARLQRLLRHPYHVNGGGLHRLQLGVAVDQQIAAADIDLVVQHQGNGFARARFLQVAVKGNDARHGGLHA